ncbi:MAG TPA: biotin/lipoyl-containing protein, partial [Salegentibacter sp.]|nr:biotin/lipoyl-containing protein [Salegentibacter sp.]
MAEVINMPRLSDTMEEGVVAKWLKQKGDKIEEGDILAEIETDKATMEFESFYEGTLLHIGIEEGETAPVDTLLAIIGEEGEDISELLKGGGDSDKDDKEDKKEESGSDKEDAEDETDGENGEIPEGVEIITMPRLSDTMEEGTVASWLKKEGDKVEEGDILAEIETDKATMEFESFYEGTLLKIGLEEGETAKVDSLLAIIGPEGTDVSNVSVDGKSNKKASEKSEKKEDKSEEKESNSSEKKSSDSSKEGGRIFASPL